MREGSSFCAEDRRLQSEDESAQLQLCFELIFVLLALVVFCVCVQRCTQISLQKVLWVTVAHRGANKHNLQISTIRHTDLCMKQVDWLIHLLSQFPQLGKKELVNNLNNILTVYQTKIPNHFLFF